MTALLRPAPVLDPPGQVRYLVLYGSHAHGTATASSDEDWRGVYQLPNEAFLGLEAPRARSAWERPPDVVLWELGHFCRMLLGGNPNIVGLLSAPDDCIADICPVISILREHRRLFVTKKMALAYWGWVNTEMRHDPAVLTPKRLSHVVRLIHEMEGAVETGTVPVRIAGETLDLVMALKRGEYGAALAYEIVSDYVAAHEDRLRGFTETLPDPPREWVGDILLRARHGEFGTAHER